MIEYNPKTWFAFIFQFHRADTFRRLLPMMLCIAAYSAGVEYLEVTYLRMTEASAVRNVSVVHTLLGFALSMLLVFRTNTAYERWWEGRKLWGSLVNSSRNLAIKLSVLMPPGVDREAVRVLLVNYAAAVRDHLRGRAFEPVEPMPAGVAVDGTRHVPNQIAAAMYGRWVRGGFTPEVLVTIAPEFKDLTDVCGACERIRKTPIPFSYSVFLKKFIFLYVMTLPISYAVVLNWLVVPVVVLIFYALASLELIAEEIENPFGTDPNDLPVDEICRTIAVSVTEVMGEEKR